MKKAVCLLCVISILGMACGIPAGGQSALASADNPALQEDFENLVERGASDTDLRPARMQQLNLAVPEAGSTLKLSKSFRELAPTTTMPFAELVGDNGVYTPVTRYPATDKYRLIVDVYHQVVMAYTKDANGRYTVPVRYMVCTSGSYRTPTPLGVFSAGSHRPRFGMFVNDGVYGQYWTQVVGRIYFHSLLYSRRDASSYTTTSYKLLGTRGSHGCIRLLVPDARWVYYHIGPGAKVEVRAGSKNDTATANIKRQLTRPPLPSTRPNVKNVKSTDVWSIYSVK